jgi:hypothetical protein
MINISQISKGIDPFLLKVFKPFHQHADKVFSNFLFEKIDTESRLGKILYTIGKKIPTRCYFKAKFNLNFTPCMFNPLFHHLIEIALWARRQDEWENMREQLSQAGITYQDILDKQNGN